MRFFSLSIISIIFLSLVTSCSEEDEYRKYIRGGEEIYYPGKIENTEVYSGKGRVRLFGLYVSDPKVTQCLVYWNVRQDSVIFPVVREHSIDTLDEIIQIEEGIHNFEFITMDIEGNRSVVVNETGQSYGDNFQDRLYNRPIRDTLMSADDHELIIAWAGIDLSTGAYQTELEYTDTLSAIQSVITPIDNDSTIIADFAGTEFKYRTFFRPDSTSIDVFMTDFREIAF